jgi:hypothetical protein
MRHLAILFVLVTALAAACGSDDNAGTGLCAENGVTATILENHPNGPHILVVPVEDVAAGVEKTYDIQGNNTGHGHFVTVSADDFADLDAGTVVMLTSSDTGAAGMDHTHPVTLSCNP